MLGSVSACVTAPVSLISALPTDDDTGFLRAPHASRAVGPGPQPAVWGEADPVLSRSAPAMAASGLCAVSVATQRAQGLPGCPA